MRPLVHILATVRNLALLDATRLVFRTLRSGFPTAEITVWGNSLSPRPEAAVRELAGQCGARYVQTFAQAHDGWVERLVLGESRPFWIVDTDVVFFDALEPWLAGDADTELAGRFEPEFLEESTGARHAARLHTAAMYFHPARLRPRMRAWAGRFPPPWGGTAQINLVRQQFIPVREGPPLFYDTCAGLWQAGIGRAFTAAEDQAFEHLHCGTYADTMSRCPGLADLQRVHQAIYADPSRARGLREAQNRYYERRQVGKATAENAKNAERKETHHDPQNSRRLPSRQPQRKVPGPVPHPQSGRAPAAPGGTLQAPGEVGRESKVESR